MAIKLHHRLTSNLKIVTHVTCIRESLFLIILLVACPKMGQAYNKVLKHQVENIAEIHGIEKLNSLNDLLVSSDFIKAHLLENKIFFQFNKTLLNKAMLFVRHGAGYKQVVWTKHGNNLLLQIPRIESLSGTIIPVNNDPSVMANTIGVFPIIKEKSDSKTFYIKVTDLFIKNAVAWQYGFKETIISNLSLINTVNYLQNEIIIKTDRVISKNNIKSTVSVDFSFLLLPKPMKPRLFDYRIGFVIEDELSAINYHPKNAKACISRWRLEKKDKSKKISDPIKPIIFYFDPGMPEKWKPYVKAGILKWLPAYELAGFKNAIQVKDAPTGDKNWSINSVNHSIVRWVTKENIRGFEKGSGSTVSNIVDFRSGEILKSDINIGSSYEHLADDYFIRCSPLDKRAQQYPFPDDLMGELIGYLVAHEAGHAFGLKDANYGEYAYPFNKMRDKHWLKHMGHTPSIMNYARHNYIAQPEDNIPPSLLIQKVGPTDIYTITWGYKPFSNSYDPKDELPYLEKMIRQQDTVLWYRYNMGQREKTGPSYHDLVVDNNDPIKSTALGLKNLKRVMELLPRVTKTKKDDSVLERLYSKTLKLWFEEMSHVLTLVGGYTVYFKSGEQKGNTYTKIPKFIQKEALVFLMANAFNRSDWLANPKITDKFQYTVFSDKITYYQLRLLSDLLDPARLKRLQRMGYAPEYSGITKNTLSKLRIGLWKEVNEDAIVIKAYRQELQSFYITTLIKGISKPKNYTSANKNDKFYVYTDYTRSLFMSELILLKKNITDHMSKVKDPVTHGHLSLCLKQINKIL
tara:strand:+ start:1874 stop:4276 length:2403 start_codon:yes stop_codon:yes gene_type:complete